MGRIAASSTRLWLLFAAFGAVLAPVPARAQAPLTGNTVEAPGIEAAVLLDWRLDAADAALSAGLVATAESLYRGILDDPGLDPRRAAEVRLSLASALVSQRRFDDAMAALEGVDPAYRRDAYYLQLAVAMYGNGRWIDPGAVRQALARVDADRLDSERKPWFYLLDGLLAEAEGRAEAVQPAFERALLAAVTEQQRRFFEGLILREEVVNTEASEPLLIELGARLEQLRGSPAAYPFARQYAIVLNNLGRQREAIAAVDRELAEGTAYTAREREQLLLLKALFIGPATVGGRDVLRELVINGQDRETVGIALQMLALNSSGEAAAGFTGFLDRMIARPEPHPLLAEMVFLKAQYAIAAGDIAGAEAAGRLLLDQFPGMERIADVYRTLAYAALRRAPPQYRTAADFLIQLRESSDDSAERYRLAVLIGDSYFLNSDYPSAADFYLVARGEGLPAAGDNGVFLRLITAETRSGRIEDALRHIDESDFRNSTDVASRWKAEWNLILALQAAGEMDRALARVRSLVAGGADGAAPPALDLRLRWLEARLSLSAGETEGLAGRVDELLGRVAGLDDNLVGEADTRLLETELLLLKAEVLVTLGRAEEALGTLEALRSGYPGSGAAERSYLTEAGYHGDNGDFARAQATLLRLAEDFPASTLAPQALLEAALYAQLRGPDYYPEAALLLNQLAERYAGSPLVFTARLKQGELLRLMNNFPEAQNLYEDLINRFPDHPQRYLAELARADSMLALARDDPGQLEDVARVLAQLLDLPGLPADFQAEAGYKWAFALIRRGAPAEKPEQVLSLLTSRLLLDGAAASLGAPGRYWISRALLELGSIHQQAGDSAAARRVYRKILTYDLPGRQLAQSRIDSL